MSLPPSEDIEYAHHRWRLVQIDNLIHKSLGLNPGLFGVVILAGIEARRRNPDQIQSLTVSVIVGHICLSIYLLVNRRLFRMPRLSLAFLVCRGVNGLSGRPSIDLRRMIPLNPRPLRSLTCEGSSLTPLRNVMLSLMSVGGR